MLLISRHTLSISSHRLTFTLSSVFFFFCGYTSRCVFFIITFLLNKTKTWLATGNILKKSDDQPGWNGCGGVNPILRSLTLVDRLALCWSSPNLIFFSFFEASQENCFRFFSRFSHEVDN